MANKNIDKAFKEKLSNAEMKYNSSHWQQFESKLDAEFGKDETSRENNDFDQDLLAKLGGQQVPYDASSWDQLTDKISEQESIKKRLILVALLQFGAVFLIFLSLWNWKGAEYVHEYKEKKEEQSQLLFAFSQHQEQFYAKFIWDLENRIEKIDWNWEKAKLSQVSLVRKKKAPQAKEQFQFLETVIFSDKSEMEIHSDQLTPAFAEAEKNTSNQLMALALTQNDVIANKNAILNLLDADIPNLAYARKEEANTKNVLIDFPVKEKKIKGAMGVVFSPDVLLIRSPDDPIYPSPSYFTDSFGKSGGLTFSLRFKSWELETGVLYSTVSYRPREITEHYSSLGGIYETSLQNIFFNVGTIPLQLKKHFNIGKKSSFYVFGGSSFNTIINSNYSIRNTTIAAPINRLAPADYNAPLLEQKDFEPGIFEGGKLFDNAYLTADLGIGFQQMVANGLSFYIQPSISTQLTHGVGPNQDRLHKLSLSLGAKYQFF